MIERLDVTAFGPTLAQSRGPTVVLFARAQQPDTKALALMIESAGASRDWQLYWIDPAEDPQWAQALGLHSLPALWLYLNGDYHANVFALSSPRELSRPAAIAAAVARARLGPPMPPPGL